MPRGSWRFSGAGSLLDMFFNHGYITASHRSLLCIDNKDCLSGVLPPRATVLARSFRMATDVDQLLERLSGFRRF